MFRPYDSVWRVLGGLLLVLGVFASAGSRRGPTRPLGPRAYFVAPDGDDANPGTREAPFQTLQRALQQVQPGDTIWLRGGIYDIDVTLDVSGRPGAPITIAAYEGEPVIFDGSAYTPPGPKLRVTGSWLILRDLEVRNSPSDGLLLTEGAGFNRLEHIVAHDNTLAGIMLEGDAHHNLVLNSDSYHNFDAATYGEHADGFGAKYDVGPGNRFVGCRAWDNADDGFDLWAAEHAVTIAYSWAYGNGFDRWGVGDDFAGDGNGFKLGPNAPLIHHCLAWDNARRGFDYNDATDPQWVYNNTSYHHPLQGFKFAAAPHHLRNNLSYADAANLIGPEVDDAYNSWNLGLTLTAGDFLSLDDTVARGPRRADGSLPYTDFLRLRNDSAAVDAGQALSFGYRGYGPDVGATEAWGLPDLGAPPDFPRRLWSHLLAPVRPQAIGEPWLEIPHLGLRVAIRPLNFDADWSTLEEIAWFRNTAPPGTAGFTVLAAHHTLPNGTAGPFIHLAYVFPHDLIMIHTHGRTYYYWVQQVARVSPEVTWPLEEPPLAPEAMLTLLSCTQEDERQPPQQRIVVRAVAEP